MRALAVLAAVGGVALSFGGGYLSTRHVSDHAAASAVDPSSPVLVREVRGELASRYVRFLDRRTLGGRSVPALLAGLHDPYTVYLTPSQYAAVQAANDGSWVGLGLRLAPHASGLRILGAVDGSPAARAGLASGDAIVAIDGISTVGLNVDVALARLQGAAGEDITLRVQRVGGLEPVDVHVVRSTIETDAVTARDVGRGARSVRVIRVRSFARGAADEIRALARDRDRVVLDLRGDPGGLLDEAVSASSVFLSRGRIVSWSGAHVPYHALDADGHALPRMRLAVVVDGGTASAAEILAAALQDHGRARVIGERTFGKASVQVVKPLRTGGALKLTVATYRTPRGRDLHGVGVVPDVDVSRGDAVRRAVGLLRAG